MEKYTQMALKMGSRSHNRRQIFASCHLYISEQDYHKYRNSSNIIRKIVESDVKPEYTHTLTLLGVKTIATKANNNVHVKACVTLTIYDQT